MTESVNNAGFSQLFPDNPFLRNMDILPSACESFDQIWTNLALLARSYLSPYNDRSAEVTNTLVEGTKSFALLDVEELSTAQSLCRMVLKIVSYCTIVLPLFALLIATVDYFFQPKIILISEECQTEDWFEAAQDPTKMEVFKALAKLRPELIDEKDEDGRDALRHACKAGNHAAILFLASMDPESVMKRCANSTGIVRDGVVKALVKTTRTPLIKFLERHPEFVTVVHSDGNPALHHIILNHRTILMTDSPLIWFHSYGISHGICSHPS